MTINWLGESDGFKFHNDLAEEYQIWIIWDCMKGDHPFSLSFDYGLIWK